MVTRKIRNEGVTSVGCWCMGISSGLRLEHKAKDHEFKTLSVSDSVFFLMWHNCNILESG